MQVFTRKFGKKDFRFTKKVANLQFSPWKFGHFKNNGDIAPRKQQRKIDKNYLAGTE